MVDVEQDQSSSNTRKLGASKNTERASKLHSWQALVIACSLLMVAQSKQWLNTRSLSFTTNDSVIPEAEWKDFEASFSGKVIRQGYGTEYKTASSVWNLAWTGKSKPEAVLIPRNEGAIAQALRFARRHDLCISVKGGGHSFLGLSVRTRCLVIWMKEFRRLTLDKLVREVSFGAGLTFGDVNPVLHNAGYGVISGECKMVGVVGYTLGCGIGFLSSMHGLASDHLVSAKVVLANGTVVVASQTENSDLLYALRGAGHMSFGIVTHITVRVFRIQRKNVFGLLSMPLDVAKDAVNKTVHAARHGKLPNEFFGAFNAGFDGKVSTELSWFGRNNEDGKRFIEEMYVRPYRNVEGTAREMAWEELEAGAPQFENIAYLARCGLVDKNNSSEAVSVLYDTFAALAKKWPGKIIAELDFVLHWPKGKVSLSPLSWERAAFLVCFVGVLPKAELDLIPSVQADVDDAFAKITPFITAGYINYANSNYGMSDYFGRHTLELLHKIKRKYDPDGVFTCSQCI